MAQTKEEKATKLINYAVDLVERAKARADILETDRWEQGRPKTGPHAPGADEVKA